jgi:TatD DNase family protein
MKIDIHRHSAHAGAADRVVRNLFHHQTQEMAPGYHYSLGLHPWHVSQESMDADIELIQTYASHNQIIAIGEAGLDKAIDTSLEIQRKAFERQIQIALEVDKPMIIHCVRAYNEIMEYKIKSKQCKDWIIHWFNASLEVGENLIRNGFYLSFGHMLFNERSKAFKAFCHLPAEKIFLETDDAEYTIIDIYARASLLRNIPIPEMEAQINRNFITLFKMQP